MAGAMELTEMQLYKVAEKVDPTDWVLLGTRLGFEYNNIQQMKEEYAGKIKEGIFNMLLMWLSMHPNYTKPDARQFLAHQFKRMKKIDLAFSLISPEVGFVAPHNVVVDGLSRHFVYNVRSLQKERELSFNVTMTSTKGPVPLSHILESLKEPGEFADTLSTCMHVLGLRLTGMELKSSTGSSLKFTVAAMDEDGVRELSKRLRSKPNRFGQDIKRVICKYTSCGIEASHISIETNYSEQEFGEVIQSFRDEVLSSSFEVPPRVNGLELACLAQELDATMLTQLGLGLGETEAEMSNLQAQGNTCCRSAFEAILFRWKARQHPCGKDRPTLASVLESVAADLLADKLRRGELRESEIEEQRRTYLQRASATYALKSLLKNRLSPRAPAVPYPREAGAAARQHPPYVNYPPVTAASELHGDTSGTTFGQHSYVNTVGLQGRTPTAEDSNDDYATTIFRTETPPCSPVHVLVVEEPLYDTITGESRPLTSPPGLEDDHTYENDTLLRAGPLQRDPTKRTLHKRQGTSTIPVIHSIDFSVLGSMWDSLALYNVTESDTGHTAGLIKLAQTLDQIDQTDIADTVWTSLVKDHTKNDYIHRFVTGSIDLLPLVITNQQDIDIGQVTPLEDVLRRTKALEYPSRIFIETDKSEDRELVAEKLGYDWALEKNPDSPLGNVDLLYVLRVADIDPGTTVGGAIVSQRICRDFKLNPDRVEGYFKNTMTEYIIVLIGDMNDFKNLLSVSPPQGKVSKKAGFRDLIKGDYLSHCIVIMTVGPQAIIGGPMNYVHYKLKPATCSDC